MLLLGHIGITAFVAGIVYLPALGAIIGALLPDIIDKGLFLIGAPCSRFIAHSIFFFPIAGLVTYVITRNKKFAIAVALGSALHIVEDLHDFVPFLYPLKGYDFASLCGPIGIAFTPYIIATETIGALLLIFTYGFNKEFLQLRKLIWDFIKVRIIWEK